MIYLAAIAFGLLAATWRWHDGRDDPIRFRNSSLIGTGIVCAAGLFSYLYSVGGWLLVPDRLWAVGIATVLVAYIVRKGFDGWEKWSYMLTTRAAPFAVFGVANMLYFQTTDALLLAASGFLVSIIYVEGTRYSNAHKEKTGSEWMLGGFTAQMWGEISHGLFVSGLVLL